MDIYKKIEDDMKTALKSGDASRLSVLRMVISAVKTLQIDKNLKSVKEEDVFQVLQKQIKQHKESVLQFKNGKREDLADKEAKELTILESYMPAPLTEEELVNVVKSAIAETGAVSKSEMGKVMKAVLEKAKGRADGKMVSELVMKFLK